MCVFDFLSLGKIYLTDVIVLRHPLSTCRRQSYFLSSGDIVSQNSLLQRGGGDFLLSLLSGVGGQLVKHRTGIQNPHSQHLNI